MGDVAAQPDTQQPNTAHILRTQLFFNIRTTLIKGAWKNYTNYVPSQEKILQILHDFFLTEIQFANTLLK